jgi:23S rRNA pseudouridine1911/1915/1917 synthase
VFERPRIIREAPSYLAVYKPPGMHSAPLRTGEGGTLLEWAASRFPGILRVRGRKALEGGLLHRLDYGTSGLALIARNQAALEALASEQERDGFVKEYEAFSAGRREKPLPGFPPWGGEIPPPGESFEVTGAFRHYGPGRRAVRPLPAGAPGKRVYRTVLTMKGQGEGSRFTATITRGFRHQIRCHLAWIGWPLLNDGLYGGAGGGDFPALRSRGLRFTDPDTGKTVVIRI